ncbi:MAG: ABC transporter ATP-binding protein [Mycobacteriaceae bacterium]|nr:ABC transporter ATP-binding protein [Mycobacteriaceae bacterium]
MTGGRAPAVELLGITKHYPGVAANSDVRLRVRCGEIHALCGENGAGKSTLMKILYGMETPDSGTIAVHGEPVRFGSPTDAIAAGIGMVHQHFMLVDNFTVLENLALGAEGRHGIGVGARAAARELMERTGLRVDLDARVHDVGVADRQRLEILKVLYRGARVIILDEPTAVLVPSEVDELFGVLRAMVADGFTFLFISHKLDEVLAVADTVTVLRRGEVVGEVAAAAVDAGQLARMMIGGALPQPRPRPALGDRHAVLTVRDLAVSDPDSGRAALGPVSLTVRAGEVLGIAGVEGNGQTELMAAIAGLAAHTGSVVLTDRGGGSAELSSLSALRRRERGIGYVAEDRTRQSILGASSLWRNRILGFQSRLVCPRPWRALLDLARARRDTARILVDFDVRAPGIGVAMASLSGGNQQKLVLGRELSGEPALLLAAHPTRGVDVGAQALIWDRIRAAQQNGIAVLLVSADLDELIELSDSIAVLLRGRVTATLAAAALTAEDLGRAMLGGAASEGGAP